MALETLPAYTSLHNCIRVTASSNPQLSSLLTFTLQRALSLSIFFLHCNG